ncbi:MAG: SAM-dependent methyltransferase [Marinobacter sp.]|nr:SAM-dependent methyltransferase [Marinobacter sp.]
MSLSVTSPTVGEGLAADLFGRWQALNQCLLRYQPLWRPVPFAEPAPAWVEAMPELAAWLDGLSLAQCEALDADMPRLYHQVQHWLPGLETCGWGGEQSLLQARDFALPERLAVDMPGRKRLQAGAFVAALAPVTGPILDWCCGKGHLARTLCAAGAGPVIGLEYDQALVADGSRLADRYGNPVTVKHQDVMDSQLTWPAGHHGVALHACGDLHRRLLQLAASSQAPRLSLAPCCYHLTTADTYQALSARVRNAPDACPLTRQELRLAVQETVTAPAHDRRRRNQNSIWRLAFDALQRHLRGIDEYLPVPSAPGQITQAGFVAFCRWAADREGIALPTTLDWDSWLAKGEVRLLQVRRHELVRHLFRRPLEYWLVLDYALFLEEQGYQVQLSRFCDRSLTPRNILLDARFRARDIPPALHSHPESTQR